MKYSIVSKVPNSNKSDMHVLVVILHFNLSLPKTDARINIIRFTSTNLYVSYVTRSSQRSRN